MGHFPLDYGSHSPVLLILATCFIWATKNNIEQSPLALLTSAGVLTFVLLDNQDWQESNSNVVGHS